jgi:hypothetical protein
LIIALTAWELYDFFVTNDVSSDPRRLGYAVLLGIVGGLVAFGISRLAPSSQRTLKLATLGTFGTFLISVLGLFAYHLTWAAPMVSKAGMWGWIVAVFLSFTIIAILVWLEFRQVWRRTL